MQWFIDIIKDWVIANYYTQAEVDEWVVPMHVSGTLDPDTVCTYHKAGDYGGKPYYIRDDGEWFIWWNSSLSIWVISYGTGVVIGPHWRRNDPNIEGTYVVAGGASGVATVTAGYGCPHLCSIDRGDPASADYTEANFTNDEAWHDLNLDHIVPAGANFVLFTVVASSAGVASWFKFRMKGNANGWNSSELRTQVAGILNSGDFVCPLDSNRKIQYQLRNVPWPVIYFTVKGWWK